jgi:hypothetical protein
VVKKDRIFQNVGPLYFYLQQTNIVVTILIFILIEIIFFTILFLLYKSKKGSLVQQQLGELCQQNRPTPSFVLSVEM